MLLMFDSTLFICLCEVVLFIVFLVLFIVVPEYKESKKEQFTTCFDYELTKFVLMNNAYAHIVRKGKVHEKNIS